MSKAIQRRVDTQQEPRIQGGASAAQRCDSSQTKELLVELPVRHHTDELGCAERRDGRAEIHNTDVAQRGSAVIERPVREKQVFIANLMPARGSWLELEIDKKGRVYVRIDRKRKLPVTVLL